MGFLSVGPVRVLIFTALFFFIVLRSEVLSLGRSKRNLPFYRRLREDSFRLSQPGPTEDG